MLVVFSFFLIFLTAVSKFRHGVWQLPTSTVVCRFADWWMMMGFGSSHLDLFSQHRTQMLKPTGLGWLDAFATLVSQKQIVMCVGLLATTTSTYLLLRRLSSLLIGPAAWKLHQVRSPVSVIQESCTHYLYAFDNDASWSSPSSFLLADLISILFCGPQSLFRDHHSLKFNSLILLFFMPIYCFPSCSFCQAVALSSTIKKRHVLHKYFTAFQWFSTILISSSLLLKGTGTPLLLKGTGTDLPVTSSSSFGPLVVLVFLSLPYLVRFSTRINDACHPWSRLFDESLFTRRLELL